ncbi:16S rRNA (cytosine(1402)-N(4))-methyltransferase RsmH [Candidatus Parcubacteria bacterium]|nr:16S rRNA (cytosine(1402)-N(4))-methyltransferase RsmH [Candidatus Parcubacteria bacterium]
MGRHVPVLLDEVIRFLDPQPGDDFIDATVDGGGHALKILERITPTGRLCGVDRDETLLRALEERASTETFRPQLTLVQGNFRELATLAQGAGFGRVKGILMDLGMSSEQLEGSGRGFSLLRDEALDMRYDSSGETTTAAEIVNSWRRDELERLFRIYGEERHARRIAEAIVMSRRKHRIFRTTQLVELISRISRRTERIHPATRVFQALRIAVNDELDSLRAGLVQALGLLRSGGRLAVIGFHSLEDRIVKNTFRSAPPHYAVLTKKPIVPTVQEVLRNPRSRSAKLRVIERIEN